MSKKSFQSSRRRNKRVLRHKRKFIPLSTELLNEQELATTDEMDECGSSECDDDDNSIIDDDDVGDTEEIGVNTMDYAEDINNETNPDEVRFLKSRQDVIYLLQEVGLYDHFKNESGSKYQIESQAQQGCKRVADFLCWAYNDSNNKSEFLQKYQALDYFATVLNND